MRLTLDPSTAGNLDSLNPSIILKYHLTHNSYIITAKIFRKRFYERGKAEKTMADRPAVVS
jgi:hypothetical protein